MKAYTTHIDDKKPSISLGLHIHDGKSKKSGDIWTTNQKPQLSNGDSWLKKLNNTVQDKQS